MMRKSSMILDADKISVHSHSASYQNFNFDKSDLKLNVEDPSLKKIQDQLKYQNLVKSLYESADQSGPSSEFKLNLTYYYLFSIIYLLSLELFSAVLWNSGNLTLTHFQIHLVCLNLLLLILIASYYLIARSKKTLKKCRNLFLSVTVLLNFYLIFADERILSKITGNSEGLARLPLSIGLVLQVIFFRMILFDSFLYISIVSLANSAIFITAHLSISSRPSNQVLAEASLIIFFSILQMIECYRLSSRVKQLFWRREQADKEDSSIHMKNSLFKVPGINTEAESVLSKCDIISSNLRSISKIIIYKDVKKVIKKSLTDLEKIKRKVAHTNFDETKIELSPELELEDRVFLTENFMPVSFKPFNQAYSVDFSENLSSMKTQIFTEIDSVLLAFGRVWAFDIFQLESSTEHSISIVSDYVLSKWSIYDTLKIPQTTSASFFLELEKAYKPNPFHNAFHAADVLHSFIFFIVKSFLYKHIKPIDIFAVTLAALAHDVGHPGLTNRYLVNTRDKLAIEYNDISVLENMHCALAFSLMSKDNCNLLKYFKNRNWVNIRRMVIEMIINTDLSKHFEILGKFRGRFKMLKNLNLALCEDKCFVLAFTLKCADLGFCGKEPALHIKWYSLASQELLSQGDLEKEKGQPVSIFCARDEKKTERSRTVFIQSISLPLYEILDEFLESEIIKTGPVELMKKNLNYWKDKRKSVDLDEKNSEIATQSPRRRSDERHPNL